MPPPGHAVPIDDPADPRLDDYRTLRDPELRKRYENEAGVFIAEGPNVVIELLRSRYATRSVLVSPKALRRPDLAADLSGLDAPVYVAERPLIEEVVAFPMHQGALAVGERLPLAEPADVLAGARTVVVLEEMNDPENMGVLFRSARALGVDAVLLGARCSDALYRRCVRVSMGHVLHVPWTVTDDPIADLADFTTIALATDGAVDLDRYQRPDRVALLVGAEGPGLSEALLAAADVRVRIRMEPGVDSLNVSVATAIALHGLR